MDFIPFPYTPSNFDVMALNVLINFVVLALNVLISLLFGNWPPMHLLHNYHSNQLLYTSLETQTSTNLA